MNRRNLISLTLKVLLGWMALTGIIWYFGEWLITAMFPLLKMVMIMLSPELAPSLKLIKSVESNLNCSIELSAWVLRPVYLNAGQYIPPGTDLKSSVGLLHTLVPLVIQGTILVTWPAKSWSQRFSLIGLGMLTAVLVVIAILPAHLLSMLETSFQDVALTGKNPRTAPWFVDWFIFCEMGGRWLLGISAAWFCIQLLEIRNESSRNCQ